MSLKRIACWLITAVLAVPAAVPLNSYASGNFPDTTGHWAERYISRAFNLDIVKGYSNGKFMPDKAVTRAEFISMVNHALDLDIDVYTSSNFKDVTGGSWYYNDISKAVAAGYAGGYSDNTFRPNTPITRQEGAVMLANILPSYKEKGNLKGFRDYRQIASSAASAVEKLSGQAYMNGYSNGKFYPEAPITRAQIAKILCDILDNETIVSGDTIVDENNTTLTGKIFVGDVTIDEDIGEGNATIDNCVILGTLNVEGGGSKSVTINNSRVANMVVCKDDSPVRVVTKGTTIIPTVTVSNACILQTSGKSGTGIQQVTVNRFAEVTLKGNFPVVNVEGKSSAVTLESGKITTLTVARSGRYSDITLTGKAQVSEATVNSESYFHGTGTIQHMSVNSDDVTYETKPKKMTVGINYDRAVGEADTSTDLEVDIDPDNRDDNVGLDAKITLTFNTSVKLATGVQISASNIKNFVTLHTASRGGIIIDCNGTINAAKKIVTLTPKAELSPNTRYYVVLADETVMNANGSKNDGDYIYFTTGTESSNSLASYDPDDGDRGVSVGASIRIRFSDDVVVYGSGAEVTDAYLQQCITFKSGDGTSGSAVAFTGTISSRDRITIKPVEALAPGQEYTVAVVANKLQTRYGGKAVTGSSSTWTTASTSTTPAETPVLSALKLTPAENSIDIGFTPNVSGTVYALATTSASVTDTQIMAGKSAAATANKAGTLSITGLTANTKYYVYALLKTSSNSKSAIVSASTTTTIVNAKLNTLTLASSGGINLLSGFDPKTSTYTVEVPYGTTSVDVSASAEASAIGPVITINGTTGSSLSAIPVSGSSVNKITLTISASNKTTATYVINVTVAGNTDLQSISVNGGAPTWIDSAYASYILSSATSAAVAVTTVDPAATIKIGGSVGTGSCTGTVPLGSGSQTITFTVTSNGHTKYYAIHFFR